MHREVSLGKGNHSLPTQFCSSDHCLITLHNMFMRLKIHRDHSFDQKECVPLSAKISFWKFFNKHWILVMARKIVRNYSDRKKNTYL